MTMMFLQGGRWDGDDSEQELVDAKPPSPAERYRNLLRRCHGMLHQCKDQGYNGSGACCPNCWHDKPDHDKRCAYVALLADLKEFSE